MKQVYVHINTHFYHTIFYNHSLKKFVSISANKISQRNGRNLTKIRNYFKLCVELLNLNYDNGNLRGVH